MIDSKQVEIGQFNDKIKKLQFKERHYQNKTDQLLMEIDELKKNEITIPETVNYIRASVSNNYKSLVKVKNLANIN